MTHKHEAFQKFETTPDADMECTERRRRVRKGRYQYLVIDDIQKTLIGAGRETAEKSWSPRTSSNNNSHGMWRRVAGDRQARPWKPLSIHPPSRGSLLQHVTSTSGSLMGPCIGWDSDLPLFPGRRPPNAKREKNGNKVTSADCRVRPPWHSLRPTPQTAGRQAGRPGATAGRHSAYRVHPRQHNAFCQQQIELPGTPSAPWYIPHLQGTRRATGIRYDSPSQ